MQSSAILIISIVLGLKLSIFDIFQYGKVNYNILSAILIIAIVLGLNVQSLIFLMKVWLFEPNQTQI